MEAAETKKPGAGGTEQERNYMQIDGEAFVAISPESVKITHLVTIQVLMNQDESGNPGKPLNKVPELNGGIINSWRRSRNRQNNATLQ